MDRIDLGQLESLFPVSWTSRGVTDIPQGSTLASIAPEETTDGTWSAIHNGRMLRPVSWEHTIINDGDQVIFSPLPEDFVAIGAWLWQALGYALVGVAVNYGISKIIGVPEVDTFDESLNQTYSFSNLQQTSAAGIPIKVVYGTHPVAGNLLELDLTGNNPGTGSNSFGSSLDMTVGLCEGEITSIDSVSINGNDISTYASLASYTANLGTNTQSALGSTGTTTTQSVGLDLIPPTELTAELYKLQDNNNSSTQWSNGLPVDGSTVTGSNGFTGSATSYSSFNGLSGDHWIKIYNASSGSNLTAAHGSSVGNTVQGHITGTNSSGGSTVLQVTYASGVPETIVTGSTQSSTTYTTTGSIDRAKLNILFPEGLYSSNNSGIQNRSTEWRYRYRNTAEVDGSGIPTEIWSPWTTSTITNDHIAPWIYSEEISFVAPGTLPAKGTYLIEIQQVSLEADSDGYRMRLDSVVEILNQVYAYPNLATLRLQINADSAINGSSIPNVIATITGRKILKWDGVSLSSPNFVAASPDNPAWIVYDILTSNRLGIGAWLDSTNIDIQSFNEFADWCDVEVSDGKGGTEKRAIWNGVFDGNTSAWDAALQVLSSARATIYAVGEHIKIKHERARPVSQLFTMGNIAEGSWRQAYLSRLERPTRIDVQYLNVENNYQPDVVGVDDPDPEVAALPQRILQIDLPGVTRESQALREARFRMNVDKLGEAVSFDADIDAIACEPGDIVRIAHDVPSWGDSGRVTAAGSSSNTIRIDRDVTLESGISYQIMIRHSDDSRTTKTITSGAGTYSSGTDLTVDSTWATAPAAGNLYSLGPFTTHSREVVITSIRTTGDLKRSIEGLVYNPDIHNDEISTATSTFKSLLNPEAIPGIVSNLRATDLRTNTPQVAISFEYPEGDPIGSAQIWERRANSQDTYRLTRTIEWPQNQIVLPMDPLSSGSTGISDREISVVAVSPAGASLPPTEGSSVTASPTRIGTIPEAPTGIVAVQDDTLLRLTWIAPQNVDLAGYQIRRGLEWVGSRDIGFTTIPEITTEEWTPTLSTGITENYWIRAISVNGTPGRVAKFSESNEFEVWDGGSFRTSNFRSSSWSGSSLSNMAVNSDGDLEISSAGTEAKWESPSYSMGSNLTYRVGSILHISLQDETWESSNYSWQSKPGGLRTWSGYSDPSLWETTIDLRFRTRTSSSGTWTTWRPLTTRLTATTFEEIQLQIIATPANEDQVIKIHQATAVIGIL